MLLTKSLKLLKSFLLKDLLLRQMGRMCLATIDMSTTPLNNLKAKLTSSLMLWCPKASEKAIRHFFL